jgi:GrpB-like predicted nucleotidyltransferase (UPF0157 family)
MVWNEVFLAYVIIMIAMSALEERIKKVMEDEVVVVPYHSDWPRMFELEKNHLFSCLPHNLVKRIEHFGSTAVPNLASKPIIDILVEVTSLEETKNSIVPILTFRGYEYFWRPTWGDDTPPYYAWFIKRDSQGHRTHHIHMVEHDFEHWERLLFRDYLIEHPGIAKEYETIKVRLANNFPNDRAAYTQAKTEFILKVTQLAKRYYIQR